jgi:1,4-dihydroxy-2-naphthoate polyprenyltransferase
MSDSVSPWLLAIRPKTLFAALGPCILGISLAYRIQGNVSLFIGFLTIACALLLQISTNLVNDYYDAKTGIDNKKRLGPQRVTQSGLIPAHKVMWAFRITMLLAFLLGIYLMNVGGWPIVIIGLSSIVLAYAYTAGPFPLSHYALGEVAALLFFGPVAVWGTFYLQTGNHAIIPIMVGLGPGLISATIMGINNLRDRENDATSGKTTLAVILGETQARNLCIILIILSSFIPILTYFELKLPRLIMATIVPYFFIKNWMHIYKGKIDSSLNDVLARTGQYLFVYSLVFSIGLIFK